MEGGRSIFIYWISDCPGKGMISLDQINQVYFLYRNNCAADNFLEEVPVSVYKDCNIIDNIP